MKDPRKVEAGRHLAAHNRKKRELKAQKSEAKSGVGQYYGIGAVIAVGVIGGLGYYIYRTKQPSHPQPPQPPKQPSPCPPRTAVWGFASRVPAGPQTNKFKMD